MLHLIRSKNFYYILLLDALFVAVSYLGAYLLRFEWQIAYQEWANIISTLPYVLLCKISVFYFFGLYGGMWRYTGLIDVLRVLKATISSSALIVLVILYLYRFQGFSRSVFIIDAFLTFVFIAGVRLSIRIILYEKGFVRFPLRRNLSHLIPKAEGRKKRLLIIGAGDAGEKMLRELMENPKLSYQVIGFLDDDPRKMGLKMHGVPVLGSISQVKEVCSENGIEEILIAIPSASSSQMRRILEATEVTGIKTRTTPGIGELINGRVTFTMVRDISFEDLLGREPVHLDMEGIGHYLRGRIVLVSGAGGSIGSELCRQMVTFHPRNLILLDKTENNLFHIEMEFRQRFPHVTITPVLGDVCNKGSIGKLFSRYEPQVVFHAAAFKHVPIVEMNPWEAVFNNVVGTKNIAEASLESGVERFVMISTDKAVRPVSVMGATKKVAEMITSCCSLHPDAASNGRRFVSVRFGNVIGSEGSVVHLFKKQIERLGPVTVTHPDMTRYFMTIAEAAKLILQAGAIGEGAEVFILDMGTPVKILDMARQLIRMSGFEPDEDIPIKFIGLRPGEKLREELITQGEGIVRTAHGKIFVLRGENDYNLDWLNQKIEELVCLALKQDASGIKSKLREIIPEYQPYDLSNY